MTRRQLSVALVVGASISVASAVGVAVVVLALESRQVTAEVISADLAFLQIVKESRGAAFPIGDGVLLRAAEVRVGSRTAWRRGMPELDQLDLVPPAEVPCRRLGVALRVDGRDPGLWVLTLFPARVVDQKAPASCDAAPWELLLGLRGRIPDTQEVVAGVPVEVVFASPGAARAEILGSASAAELRSGPPLIHAPTSAHPSLATGPDNALPGEIRMTQLTAESLDAGASARPALVAELLVSPSAGISVNGGKLRSQWLLRWATLLAAVASALFQIFLGVLGHWSRSGEEPSRRPDPAGSPPPGEEPSRRPGASPPPTASGTGGG